MRLGSWSMKCFHTEILDWAQNQVLTSVSGVLFEKPCELLSFGLARKFLEPCFNFFKTQNEILLPNCVDLLSNCCLLERDKWTPGVHAWRVGCPVAVWQRGRWDLSQESSTTPRSPSHALQTHRHERQLCEYPIVISSSNEDSDLFRNQLKNYEIEKKHRKQKCLFLINNLLD